MQVQACLPLQAAYDGEEVSRLRVPAWAKHPDQTFGRRARSLCDPFKTHGRLDVVAQERFAGFEIAAEHRIYGAVTWPSPLCFALWATA